MAVQRPVIEPLRTHHGGVILQEGVILLKRDWTDKPFNPGPRHLAKSDTTAMTLDTVHDYGEKSSWLS